MQPGPLNAASLPPNTQVGPWRIVDARGCGAFGAVYLAKGKPGLVALKLALHPRDARFAREAELLSRIRCPAVPRLIDQGEWQSHPYLVMQWIEGVPLYEWARVRAPSSRQVLRVLATLARALEATHAARGVHRDVRGGNVLVRLKDDQPFLIDFGAGSYKEATPITGPVFPPGTRQYRAPEAIRFAVNIRQSSTKVYAPRPADDVFALGVTAYHLVTGEYPPTADPLDEGAHVWETEAMGPEPARALNPRCTPELSGFISQMLFLRPEARGSARELAVALEKAARKAGSVADESLFRDEVIPERITPRAADLSWLPWLAGPVALGAAWLLMGIPSQEEVMQAQGESRDAGTSSVGEAVLTAPGPTTQVPSNWMPIAVDLPSRPLPGQARPDASGRCRYASWVPINGGCWIQTRENAKDCREPGYAYKDACYQPAYPPPSPATSDSPDAGG